MAKERACKTCRIVHEGAKCPKCKESNSIDTFKGKVEILNPDESEIAKELKIREKGLFAIKLR